MFSADYFFTAVFTFEMLTKVIAMGFVVKKASWCCLACSLHALLRGAKLADRPFPAKQNSYLRDGFNVLDALVVCLAYINYAPGVGNYTALRVSDGASTWLRAQAHPRNLTATPRQALRVLRTLRTLNKVQGMKMIVITLLRSAHMLLDVVGLFAFIMFVYGLAGVQIFGGVLQ